MYVVGCVLVAVVWALNVSLVPYFLKWLIYSVEHYHGDPTKLGSVGFWPALCLMVWLIAFGIVFRFYEYMMLRFIPNIKRDIQQQVLFYLEGHSYKYFQDNFAGSLSNKIMDLVRGVPEVFIVIMENFIPTIMAIIIAIITMFFVNPIFSVIFLLWSSVYVYVSYLFSKKGNHYVLALAEAKSTLSGKQVDSISNMVNILLFARKIMKSTM